MPQDSLFEASKGLGDLTSYANKQQSFGGEPRSSNPAVFAKGPNSQGGQKSAPSELLEAQVSQKKLTSDSNATPQFLFCLCQQITIRHMPYSPR